MKYLKKYKIFENVQQSKSFLKKNNIPEDHKDYLYLKNMLQNNIGYLFWFVKMHFEQSIPLTELKELYSKIKSNSVIFNNLPKNIIEYDTYENILDDIIKSEKDIQYKKVVNELLPFQKRWLEDDSTLKDLIYLISGRKDYKNFFKKISAYKNLGELRNGLANFFRSSEYNSFEKILKNINDCDSKLIYSSKEDNIIICQVNYKQIVNLGGDTSWCIVRSESTFNSYSDNHYFKQYIIFLTDLYNNFSKIGATIGFKYSTAHLKNDEYISEKKLLELLESYNFNLKNLYLTLDDFKNELDNGDFKKLMRNIEDDQKEYILRNKKLYEKDDLKYFTKKQIEEYDLNNKVILPKKDIENIDDLNKNIHRIKEKFNMSDISKLNIPPRIVDNLIERNLINNEKPECKYGSTTLEFFKKYKRTDALKTIKSISYWDKEIFSRNIKYLLGYFGLFNCTLDEIMSLSMRDGNKYNLYLDTYEIKDLITHLKLNTNLKLSTQNIYDIHNNFLKFEGTFTKVYEEWLKSVKNFPEIKELAEDNIFKNYKGRDSIFYLEEIKELYPERYPEVKEYQDVQNYTNLFDDYIRNGNNITREVGPNGYLVPTKIDRYNKKDWVINPNPKELYEKFGKYFSKLDFKTSRSKSINDLYLILTLVKLDKINEINTLKVKIKNDFAGYVIRATIDDEYTEYFNTEYFKINKNFKLNKKEKEKLHQYITSVDYNDSRYSENINLAMKLKTNSLIYYKYDWGFNIFFRMCKGLDYDELKGLNMFGHGVPDMFQHIISYLIIKKMDKELKDLCNKIIEEFNFNPKEIENLENFIKNRWYAS